MEGLYFLLLGIILLLNRVCMSCRLVKFQRVNVLTIFFASNQGDKETTIIQQISLIGTGGETFNVSEIKKVGEGDQ